MTGHVKHKTIWFDHIWSTFRKNIASSHAKKSQAVLLQASALLQSLRPNHIAAGWEVNPASQDVGTTRKLIAALVLHRLSLSYEEPSTNPDHKKDPSTQSWLLHIWRRCPVIYREYTVFRHSHLYHLTIISLHQGCVPFGNRKTSTHLGSAQLRCLNYHDYQGRARRGHLCWWLHLTSSIYPQPSNMAIYSAIKHLLW